MHARLFFDLGDPWSYIASVRFERAMGIFTITTGVVPEVSYRCFYFDREIGESRPLSHADLDLDIESVVVAARKSGIEINVEDGLIFDSLPALRLVLWVEAELGKEAQKLLIDELFRAAFLEGADLADPFVLATRASLVGMNAEITEAFLAENDLEEEVLLQTATAIDVGFDRPPVIVVDDKWVISGVQTQDSYIQALSQIHQGLA